MCGKGRHYLNVSQLWDGRVGSDPPSSPLLPSFSLLLPLCSSSLSSLLVLSLEETKSILWQPSWIPLQSGLWLTQDLLFSVVIIFSAAISCSFLPAFVLVVMQSLISPVWRRSFPSWTCWERRRAIQGETLSCTVPVSPAGSDPLRDYPHPRTGEAKWAHSALVHSYPIYRLKFVKRRKCFGII